MKTGKCIRVFEGHTATVGSVSVMRDSRRIVSGSHDHQVRIWDMECRQSPTTTEGHKDSVFAIAVSKDSKLVVSGGRDRRICVWSATTGEWLRHLEGHIGPITSLAITPDSQQLVSGGGGERPGKSGELGIWNLNTGEGWLSDDGHGDCIDEVCVTLDGRRAISRCQPYETCVWGLNAPQEPKRFRYCGPFGTAELWQAVAKQRFGADFGRNAFAVSADGCRILSGDRDGVIRVWDLSSRRAIAFFLAERPITAVAFGSGNLIVGGDEGGLIYILTLENIIHGTPMRDVWRSSQNETCMTVCPNCGEWLSVSASLFGEQKLTGKAFAAISRWKVTRALLFGKTETCRECGDEVRLNGFAITLDSDLLHYVQQPIKEPEPLTKSEVATGAPYERSDLAQCEPPPVEISAEPKNMLSGSRVVFAHLGYGDISMTCLSCGYEDFFENGEQRLNACPKCGAKP